MRVYEHVQHQRLELAVDEVFPFFAEARNLERITPPWLRFRVLTGPPREMAAGTLLHYRLRLRGVPIGWVTQIEAWEPERRFVDRQLHGPYALWHHEHTFHADGDATIVGDRVRYALPLGPVGRLAHAAFVGRDVRSIFTYRRRAVDELVRAGRFTPRLEGVGTL